LQLIATLDRVPEKYFKHITGSSGIYEIRVEVGSDITICHKPNRSEDVVEELETKFICFGKKNMDRDYEGEITGYNSEDDEKCLCLMIDSSKVNFNDEIPFIRTLFKTGYHYEYQIMRRTELLFIDKKNNITLDYFDCTF
jgi:hypothetical protein